MNIVKGMNVRVISGNHKGKEGKVLYVIPKKDRIIIEGINILKKHTRPTQENPLKQEWVREKVLQNIG